MPDDPSETQARSDSANRAPHAVKPQPAKQSPAASRASWEMPDGEERGADGVPQNLYAG